MHLTKTLCTRLSAAALAACTLITPTLAAPGTVTAQDGLRLRAGSSTSSKILTTLSSGTAVDVLEAVDDSWYRISVGDQQGYVSSRYIALDVSNDQLPSAPEPPAESEPEPPAQSEPLVGTITASSLNIRSGPGSGYDKVGTLSQGTQLVLLEKVDNWYRIDGGYISAQYVEIYTSPEDEPDPSAGTDTPSQTEPPSETETPAQLAGVVTASTLNVRSGPGSSYEKVSTLSSGAQVTLLEEVDGWYRIDGGYISAQYVTVLDESISKLQAQIVAYARTFLGYPYVYGANGPNAFDCSSLMQYIYKHFGYSINRTATAQLKNGVTVSKENLQPGDLVFFNSKFTGVNNASHVGIYIGDGQFLHASSPEVGVVISDLYSVYYKSVYTTARRIV